jgi:cellulose synthase/poly-beta-1,6-N-acetylglucosamine synthase-like glycosyltransferase
MENLSFLDAILFFQGAGAVAYICFLIFISIGLSRLTSEHLSDDVPYVSVIIAARNEEVEIALSLKHLVDQTYSSDNYEIIVVDDHSEDATFEICRKFADDEENITVLSLGDYGGVSPKKAALKLGIQKARGEIILTTDADCRVPPDWIKIMARYFDSETGAVASWLVVEEDRSLLSKVESLDVAALVLVGAGGFGLGRPFVANGANFGYRKKVYQELNGFDGVENFVSGDDDLFLHKVVNTKKWKCRFAADAGATVCTRANDSLAQFFAQRFRWASKGSIYPAWLVALEVVIYAYYAILAATAVIFVISGFTKWILILPFVLKFTADFLFLKRFSKRAGVSFSIVTQFFAEWLQIFYVIVVGIGGILGSYTWKGRTYTRGRMKRSKR